MKKFFLAAILCFFTLNIYAQGVDMTSFTYEYMRADGTFAERLTVLEVIRDSEISGIGEFYHDCLKFLLLRFPDISTQAEQEAADKSAAILCRGLAAEKYSDAAGDLWQVVQNFDTARAYQRTAIFFDGITMQEALVALGEVDGKDFIPQIVQRLNDYNTQTFTDAATRVRAQRGIVGCIRALETFKDARGYRPVFFVSIGSYDTAIREMASFALPNILEDPADIIIEIIQDSSSTPPVKLGAWKEMIKSSAPNDSKARVAAVALNIGWTYQSSNMAFQTNLREMRKGAIDIIRQMGAADDSVYVNLDRSFTRNYVSNTPDLQEISKTLSALGALKTDEAVAILYKFLSDLNSRRRSGPWGQKERQVFEWLIPNIGATGTRSQDVIRLLTVMQRSSAYTGTEQRMIGDALKQLGR